MRRVAFLKNSSSLTMVRSQGSGEEIVVIHNVASVVKYRNPFC
jgi:hypothetical protein